MPPLAKPVLLASAKPVSIIKAKLTAALLAFHAPTTPTTKPPNVQLNLIAFAQLVVTAA
jgi:hypothetical protein